MFVLIPTAISTLILFSWSLTDLTEDSWTVALLSILVILATSLVTLFYYAGMTITPLKKVRFSLHDLIREGKKAYWRYIGFVIVVMLFMAGLFVLLIVPAIIFAVYWILSSYIYLGEKRRIGESLKKSRALIKGNWWRVAGYLVLLVIIGFLFALITSPLTTSPEATDIVSSLVSLLLTISVDFITALVLVPVFILFFKNLYQELNR